MRIRAGVWAFLGLFAASPLVAQDAVPDTLSLERALDIARSNNPTYLQARNDRELADWDVRQAYGQLLPTASASSSVTWQGAGEQTFGSLTLQDLGFGNLPSYYLSSYGVSLGLSLDWSTLRGPAPGEGPARGHLGPDPRFGSRSGHPGDGGVSRGAPAGRGAAPGAAAAREQPVQPPSRPGSAGGGRGHPHRRRPGRGPGGPLPGRRCCRRRTPWPTARMRLLQQLGVSVDQDVQLSTTFDLTEPTWTEEELLDRALQMNPGLEASRSSRRGRRRRRQPGQGRLLPLPERLDRMERLHARGQQRRLPDRPGEGPGRRAGGPVQLHQRALQPPGRSPPAPGLHAVRVHRRPAAGHHQRERPVPLRLPAAAAQRQRRR